MGHLVEIHGILQAGQRVSRGEEVTMGSRSAKREVMSQQQRGPRCALGGKRGGDAPLAAEQEVESG